MEPKIKIKEVSSYERKLTIEIPSAEIDQEMESQFASLVKSVKLKGFRPGHVPLNVVKQRYHNQVRGESISKLVDLSYSKALAQHELIPVSRPKIDLKPHENGKPLSYEALVEIKPNIEIKKYTGLQAEKEKFTLKKEEVDQAIERLREAQSQLKAIDKPRGVKDKDHIVIDFKGTLDGKVFPGGTATNLLYEMGSGQFIPDFEAGIKGMKPDENKKIDATFPKDFHDKKIAGKKTQFDVTVKEIKVKELPKLDDAFAKQTPGCKTVADLRKKAEDDLRQMHQDRVQKNLEKVLLDELVKKNPIDVPPSMVERQFEHLVQDSKQRLQQMGLQGQRLDDTVEGWKAGGTTALQPPGKFCLSTRFCMSI